MNYILASFKKIPYLVFNWNIIDSVDQFRKTGIFMVLSVPIPGHGIEFHIFHISYVTGYIQF